MSHDPDSTHFGYEEIPRGEKTRRVRGVFDSVAGQYDLMNDLMSMGLHRLWKRMAISLLSPQPGEVALDLAAGTGDLTAALARHVGEDGHVVSSDINAAMLDLGRDRLIDRGIVGNLSWVLADAEKLPFADGSFDAVSIGFGLRNVTDQRAALAEMHRVLRPGGRALVLEFSRPVLPALSPVYDWYSFNVLPALGRWVAGDSDSYRYLAESIRMHPDQESLRELMTAAGFQRCQYFNLSGGIVAIHRGYRV